MFLKPHYRLGASNALARERLHLITPTPPRPYQVRCAQLRQETVVPGASSRLLVGLKNVAPGDSNNNAIASRIASRGLSQKARPHIVF